MKKLKILLVAAMLALVPLRALAAVTTGICPDHHDRLPGAELLVHEHGSADGDASSHHDDGGLSVCSLCTACCSGASFVAETRAVVALAIPEFEPIPFFGRDPGAPHPDKLERPPLPR